MGLKFCNEAIMCLAQLYPPSVLGPCQEMNTPLQEALIKRLGPNAYPFTMEITPLAPPSVQLVPAKEYRGAPIGTSYDVRAYVAERADEKLQKRSTVRMGLRVLQHAAIPPHRTIVKTFMMSEGQIELEGSLDKSIYSHGESVFVNIQVNNRSHKTVRRIKAFIVQHVDVCMFSNGKFKNVVANIDSKEGCPIQPNTTYTKTYALKPVRSSTKNWIALEDSYSKLGTSLASTVTPTSSDGTPSERNVFAIYVSYYVKIKLIISVVTVTEVSLKLPFTLMHTCTDSIGMEYDVQQTISANMLPSLNFEKENILTEKAADDT
ncbi:arrestin homolog [Chrysoperla carnea]|uniref:arrestin homolog n=1 Tax=Chrysoperla carnea TaxID=189513 RepID=UPI001D0949B3|nr:arrestin homolog [Chrysoperla carnea]